MALMRPVRPERAAQPRVEGPTPPCPSTRRADAARSGRAGDRVVAAASAALVVVLSGCPAKGPGSTPARRDAGDGGLISGTDSAATDGAASASGQGRVSVKVLWPTAPASVRASPGYTACHTPRRARAQIGTLHGVADAFVVLPDLPAVVSASVPAAPGRLKVRDCAVGPPALLARGALEIQTQDTAHTVTVERIGKPWLEDDGIIAPVTLARAQLPVLGHTVTVAIDEPGAIRVHADGAGDDAAWVLAPPHRYAGITDEVGALGIADVPAGTHTIVAWLPPRAGQTAQRATGTVTVVAGETADVELTFVP
jgi:hypothetical protein